MSFKLICIIHWSRKTNLVILYWDTDITFLYRKLAYEYCYIIIIICAYDIRENDILLFTSASFTCLYPECTVPCFFSFTVPCFFPSSISISIMRRCSLTIFYVYLIRREIQEIDWWLCQVCCSDTKLSKIRFSKFALVYSVSCVASAVYTAKYIQF